MAALLDKLKLEATFWLARRLPHCRDLVRVMSESLERPLTLRERAVLRLHFLYCEYCRNYLRSLRVLRGAARAKAALAPDDLASAGPRSADRGSALSPEARDRIRRALAERPADPPRAGDVP